MRSLFLFVPVLLLLKMGSAAHLKPRVSPYQHRAIAISERRQFHAVDFMAKPPRGGVASLENTHPKRSGLLGANTNVLLAKVPNVFGAAPVSTRFNPGTQSNSISANGHDVKSTSPDVVRGQGPLGGTVAQNVPGPLSYASPSRLDDNARPAHADFDSRGAHVGPPFSPSDVSGKTSNTAGGFVAPVQGKLDDTGADNIARQRLSNARPNPVGPVQNFPGRSSFNVPSDSDSSDDLPFAYGPVSDDAAYSYTKPARAGVISHFDDDEYDHPRQAVDRTGHGSLPDDYAGPIDYTRVAGSNDDDDSIDSYASHPPVFGGNTGVRPGDYTTVADSDSSGDDINSYASHPPVFGGNTGVRPGDYTNVADSDLHGDDSSSYVNSDIPDDAQPVTYDSDNDSIDVSYPTDFSNDTSEKDLPAEVDTFSDGDADKFASNAYQNVDFPSDGSDGESSDELGSLDPSSNVDGFGDQRTDGDDTGLESYGLLDTANGMAPSASDISDTKDEAVTNAASSLGGIASKWAPLGGSRGGGSLPFLS